MVVVANVRVEKSDNWMLKHLATRKVTAKNQTQLTPKIMLGPPEFAAHSESWEDNPGRETSNNQRPDHQLQEGKGGCISPTHGYEPRPTTRPGKKVLFHMSGLRVWALK